LTPTATPPIDSLSLLFVIRLHDCRHNRAPHPRAARPVRYSTEVTRTTFFFLKIVTTSWLRIDYLHRDACSWGKVYLSQSLTHSVLESSSYRGKEYPAIW
jgi:hypothetical protein